MAMSLGDAPAAERATFGGSLAILFARTVEKNMWKIWETVEKISETPKVSTGLVEENTYA